MNEQHVLCPCKFTAAINVLACGVDSTIALTSLWKQGTCTKKCDGVMRNSGKELENTGWEGTGQAMRAISIAIGPDTQMGTSRNSSDSSMGMCPCHRMCGRSVARPIDTYRSNKLGAARVIEFVAPPAGVDIPQPVGCGCRLRYRHFHAERRRCMVDGVTRSWTGLRRAHANSGFATLLSARPSCRFRRRYLRSSQAVSG